MLVFLLNIGEVWGVGRAVSRRPHQETEMETLNLLFSQPNLLIIAENPTCNKCTLSS